MSKLEFDEKKAIEAFREISNSKTASTLKQDIVDAMRWQFDQDRSAYQRLLDEAENLRRWLTEAVHDIKCTAQELKEKRGEDCDEKCSSYGHSWECSTISVFEDDAKECDDALKRFDEFKKGIGK